MERSIPIRKLPFEMGKSTIIWKKASRFREMPYKKEEKYCYLNESFKKWVHKSEDFVI